MFEYIDVYLGDLILMFNENFQKDLCDQKVNLSIGIYFDVEGWILVMGVVCEVEIVLQCDSGLKLYLLMVGLVVYCDVVQLLVFGVDYLVCVVGCIVMLQMFGGLGVLKVGVDFLKCYFLDL